MITKAEIHVHVVDQGWRCPLYSYVIHRRGGGGATLVRVSGAEYLIAIPARNCHATIIAISGLS
jgi:hypothetical protein